MDEHKSGNEWNKWPDIKPSEEKYYILYGNFGKGEPRYWIASYNGKGEWSIRYEMDNYKILAWAELPEPLGDNEWDNATST